MRQLSDELVACARQRIETPIALRREAHLRRATSDLYFAIYHAVCGALVEPIGMAEPSAAHREIFSVLYRLPDHAYLAKRCRDALSHGSGFAESLTRFAKMLLAMQNKRIAADYDAVAQFAISTVSNDLQLVETVLRDFWEAPIPQRTAFACFLAIRARTTDR